MHKVIVNTTPLIALCRTGNLDILQKKRTVIIDDLNAKKHAKYLGLPVTGTLGVLIRAKQCGYIPALRPVLEKLVEENIYIKPSLIDLCLKQVGE